ncbi:hypothetical protein BpHYR1_037422 [Brachionus plicatilis]|uniref:Uncharacterized protein n=1 Tax=Brachionus plicatilis TaxID=10195 RepID=A0A3M7P315_BRAPC|nr:hypothetical protein BpHYR1_037422 [Brachionus plicatilis]
MEQFKTRVPKWGAKIHYSGENDIKLTNTCCIDYFLFSFWCAFKLNKRFLSEIPTLALTEKLKDIIRYVKVNNWDKVREIWVNNFMKLKIKPKNNSISVFGSEGERFIKYITGFQTNTKIQ